MARKYKTSWRDLLARALELESSTNAGKINIRLSVLLIILTVLVCIPTTAEIISGIVLSFVSKDPIGAIAPATVNTIVVGTFFAIVFCGGFLVYAEHKVKP